MEGQLPCLKFLVGEGPSASHILGARNDNGETPKMLAQQFYKEQVVEYISNIEWERDHPEESESEWPRLFPVFLCSGDSLEIQSCRLQSIMELSNKNIYMKTKNSVF